MFKNKKEFAQAMMEGRKFLTPQESVCFYDENTIESSPFRVLNRGGDVATMMTNTWDLYNSVTEKHWLTKPCLCWVENEIYPVIIYAYKPEKEYPYNATGNSYKTAKPLNEGEIKRWLRV